MLVPTVHLNGTARDDLLGQVTDALDRGRDFVRALEAMAPHGRDYYPQGKVALVAATMEHEARIAIARTLLDDLNALAEAIADA